LNQNFKKDEKQFFLFSLIPTQNFAAAYIQPATSAAMRYFCIGKIPPKNLPPRNSYQQELPSILAHSATGSTEPVQNCVLQIGKKQSTRDR